MKDSILKLKDNKDYYVLEEIEHKNKKYILAIECNLEKEEINEEYLVMMEVKQINNQLFVDEINDDIIGNEIALAFKAKYQNN